MIALKAALVPDSKPISRRAVLKIGAASAALPLAASRALSQSTAVGEPSKPRHIIFMISDGMSPGVPALAEAFSHLVRGKGTNFHALARDPNVIRGFFDMASLNSLVTDSAAASSAWGSGSRVFNWTLNMLPDQRPLTPLAPLAKQAGRSVGLITTTRLTHATPAGFAAVVPNRDFEDDIAPQYLEREIDVLLGGGMKHFDPARRRDKRDMLTEYRNAGYAICRSRDELLGAPNAAKVMGIFADDHLPFTIDRNREPSIQAQVPTLAELARIGLHTLAASRPAGFLAQIEGGRVDHAGHNNDAAGLLWDQLAFDDAIGAAMAFRQENPETLVIITADHGTGNPGLSGHGVHYHRSNQRFEVLARSTASFEAMQAKFNAILHEHLRQPDVEEVIAILKWGTGIDLDQRDAAVMVEVMNGRGAPETNKLQTTISGIAGQILGNHSGVNWTSVSHTSDYVLTLAFGPGAERFNGLLKNTEAFDHIAQLLGITHRNPAMSADEARKFAIRPREATDEHG